MAKKDVIKLIQQYEEKLDSEPWTGTLAEYLQMAVADTKLNRSAHEYVRDMVISKGVRYKDSDEKKETPIYEFFANDLFGIEKVHSKVMQYFKSAAAGSEVARRIVLMFGPTSSGKSQTAALIKEGLEEYSKTTEGKIYAIDGCPMQENPLNALPKGIRKKVQEDYGIILQGDLCPRCAHILKEEYNGDIWKIPVKRFFFSEMNRSGIGTFQPADPKSQNHSELVGSVNFAKLEQYGVESHPMAYIFDGELNVGNRGFVEFIELLKVDPKFRYILLTLAQEKRIKAERFPLIYADLVPFSHSVTGDMPVPYIKNGIIGFKTMEKLVEDNDTNIAVLAVDKQGDSCWTKVVSFHKHQFTGNLVRTIQKNGVVDTTYNHSIIGANLEPFYPEEKKNILAFRKFPETAEIYDVRLPIPNDLHYVEDKIFVRPTGNKKSDGEFGKYWLKKSYNGDDLKNLLKVICWFVTEGHVNNQHAIISQQGVDELKLIKKASESISSCVGSLYDRSDKDDKTSRLHLSSRVWRRTLEFLCGKYSQNKKLPDFIFSLAPEYREFILRELVSGDGSDNPFNSNIKDEEYLKKYFSYKTTSKMLASQIGFLATSLGYDFSVSHSYTKTGKEAFKISYRNRETGAGKNKIENIFVEDLTVYDIECQDNHSFVCGVGNVVCHNTNESEYLKFLGQESEEALHDRLWVIKSPYNLSVSEEIKIYDKLVSSVPEFKNVHIAPHTFEMAAMFAILSRLNEPVDKKITLVQKMHLFDDKQIDGISNEDAKTMMEENERDGMVGVSPRYIVNRLSACFTKDDQDYINPIDAIRSIVEGFETNAKLDKDDIDRFEQLISECVNEYDKIALNEVQKAFFVNFETEIQTLLKNYLENAEAYLEDGKVKNEFGDFDEPDERLMRNIEEKIDVTETGKKTFRAEVVRKMLRAQADGEYDYASHPKLKEGLEQQLFDERKDTIRLTVSTRNPDPDELRRKNEVLDTLVEKYNYTVGSANSLLRYVDTIMKRNNKAQ